MKYAVEMGSDAIIYTYIQGFIKIVSALRKFVRRIHRHTDDMVIA
jgi:hypothetical protein